jgi:Protein of unknown function (DUF2892)
MERVMQTNVGSADKLLRIVLGLILLVGAFFFAGAIRWIALPGAILLATGVFNFCPLYQLLGINTCKIK